MGEWPASLSKRFYPDLIENNLVEFCCKQNICRILDNNLDFFHRNRLRLLANSLKVFVDEIPQKKASIDGINNYTGAMDI